MVDFFLFIGLPYAALAVGVLGCAWRWRTQRFSYSSLSSQFLEERNLYWGSLPWHLGLAVVLLGHVVAFTLPGFWSRLVSVRANLLTIECIGMAGALLGLAGLGVLLIRRLASARLRAVTTPMDVAVLGLLLGQVACGLLTALQHRWGAIWATGTVMPYLWSLFTLRPDVSGVVDFPVIFKLHLVGAWLLLLLLPFTRLVHLLLLPITYLFRPPQKVIWNTPRRGTRAADGATITDWRPEDAAFWETEGWVIAHRNLWISIPALLLAFAVWMVWSVVVVKLKAIGFKFTEQQEFWLIALPALSGATLRILYSFVVPIFGGRNWTVLATASLLIPAVGIGLAVQNPHTPYAVFVALALLCGFGGGNFASSMSNINYFFPKARKGTALGLNAGLGNLGVSVMQFLVPLAIGTAVFGSLGGAPQQATEKGVATQIWLQNAGYVWAPMIVAVVVATFFGMNNLDTAKASFADQAVVFKRKHNWIMCWLYLGTFGSFIGYAAAFPKLIKFTFADVDPLRFAFLGPLVGALARPIGGWVSDKLGGARVTFWNFLGMIAAVGGVLYFLHEKSFAGFLTMFLLLFVMTGVGSASTFGMIPVIFLNERLRAAQGQGQDAEEQARRDAARESSSILGFSSALGAYGGFIIPIAFGNAIKSGSPQTALVQFLAFYVTCIALTWWYYSRKGAEAPC